jgi:hypothetical protein
MRSLLLAVLLLFLPARDLAAQELLDKIADECCPCIDAMRSDTVGGDAANARMGVCMLGKALPYKKELKKKYHIDLDHIDGEKGREFGQLIGVHLVTRCPNFTEFAMKLAADQSDEPPPPPPGEGLRVIGGVIQETRPSAFHTVVVRTDEGITYELLLLDHVTNAERVYADPATARGLSANWTYEEREFLEPYSRSYKMYRVIRGIELREP